MESFPFIAYNSVISCDSYRWVRTVGARIAFA